MLQQTPLPLAINTPKTFEQFIAGPNKDLVLRLRALANKTNINIIYLWGEKGSGCSHLLHALCHQAAENGIAAMYIPLRELELAPAILDNLTATEIICIDDIDTIARDPAWNEALFHLYNQRVQQQLTLVMAAHRSPHQTSWCLPDLASRLKASSIEILKPLDDQEKVALLIQQTKLVGLTLTQTVAEYLINHYSRDNHELQKMIDRLDQASLIHQRRLTIPFIKETLQIK